MGYDAYAHAAWGVKASRSDISSVKSVPGCEAKFGHMRDGCPNSGTKFCPECGQPTKDTSMVELDLPKDVELNLAYGEDDDGILGYLVSSVGSQNGFRTIKLPSDEMKAEFLTFLKKNNIKGEPQLYLYLHESI